MLMMQSRSKNASGNVVFDNVAFSYVPERPLIRNLNLEVKPGQRSFGKRRIGGKSRIRRSKCDRKGAHIRSRFMFTVPIGKIYPMGLQE